MFTSGFVIIPRSLLKWRWYKNQNTKSLFFHCLLKANYTECGFEDITVGRGQFVSSIASLSEETGLTPREVRTALSHLKSTKEIECKPTSKFTLITVKNYDRYTQPRIFFDKPATSGCQASDIHAPSERQQYNKDNKENKNNNDEKRENTHAHGKYNNVFLTESEKNELYREFPRLAGDKIERLSEYMAMSGKKYKNHYAAVRMFCCQDADKVKTDDEPSYGSLKEWSDYYLYNMPSSVKNP